MIFQQERSRHINVHCKLFWHHTQLALNNLENAKSEKIDNCDDDDYGDCDN